MLIVLSKPVPVVFISKQGGTPSGLSCRLMSWCHPYKISIKCVSLVNPHLFYHWNCVPKQKRGRTTNYLGHPPTIATRRISQMAWNIIKIFFRGLAIWEVNLLNSITALSPKGQNCTLQKLHLNICASLHNLCYFLVKYGLLSKKYKNSIGDARTPQPREIVFDTVRYRRSETVQISKRLSHQTMSVT